MRINTPLDDLVTSSYCCLVFSVRLREHTGGRGIWLGINFLCHAREETINTGPGTRRPWDPGIQRRKVLRAVLHSGGSTLQATVPTLQAQTESCTLYVSPCTQKEVFTVVISNYPLTFLVLRVVVVAKPDLYR